MDKLKKVGLTALGTALVSTTAMAGELGVSGTAKISFFGEEETSQGNGWASSQSIIFSGSADLDNGWTVSYQSNMADTIGNHAITIDMGDMGALSFGDGLTGGPVSAWDDKTPTANEESYFHTADATGPDGGYAASESFKYTVDVMEGLQFHGGYNPSDTGEEGSSTEYGVAFTGVEGLNVGIAAGDNEAAANVVENTVLYATYAIDSFSVGIQDNSMDSEATDADWDFRGYGISYAVSEDLSVSYGMADVEYENTSLEDQESSAISISYTNGSVTVSATHAEVENIAGASTADRSGYEINFALAF